MQIHRHWQNIADQGASVAMGNFDGVHLGHQSVINAARAHGPLGVITFEPHPRQYFAPTAPAFRLMNAEARAYELAKLGVEHLYQLPFDADMASFTAHDFAKTVLCDGLGIRHITVGADFCFGKGRLGRAEDLRRLGAEMGFGVTIADLIDLDGAAISSTAIRTALTEGNPARAAALLGHWHAIEGEVVHGAKRGREFGYPTANMNLAGLHLPRIGVYAVLVDILTGPQMGRYKGAASLGVRPMFGENMPNLETFIFDFDGDLYGHHLSISLVEYLRPELKFDGLQALLDQMAADCLRARDILAPF
jgi:riboflavin kinase/FMN adenylyltransferase